MTNEEARAVFLRGSPVVCGEITYSKITALICRKGPDGIFLQVELLDKGGNSVTITQADRVKENKKYE